MDITFSQGKRRIHFVHGVPVPMVGCVEINSRAFDINKRGAVRNLADFGLGDGVVKFTPLNFWIEDSKNRLVRAEDTDFRTYTVTGNVVNFCFRNEGPQEKVLYVQRYDRHGNVIPYFEAILPPQKEWV